MYIVKKGAVKICLFNDDKETILNFATEGDLVCNLISFFTVSLPWFTCKPSKRPNWLA
jgi:hypothetical protein